MGKKKKKERKKERKKEKEKKFFKLADIDIVIVCIGASIVYTPIF